MNFTSDNAASASPAILAALADANHGPAPAYGADPITARCRARIADLFGDSAIAHPVATGTAANALALACVVPPYGAVLCAAEAHIDTDECGAPEFYTGGAKVVALPSPDGKLRPAQIDAAMARAADGGVHHVLPTAVSITNATEWGTVYRPAEVAAIAAVCRRHDLALHMDGARFANAVVGCGADARALAPDAGVDVLSFGATKNGALAAEAVVFFRPDLAAGFERRRKRAGQLWSKLRYLSAQLDAYLENDLWLRNARHANAMATRLAKGLAAIPDAHLLHPVEANELFVALPETRIAALEAAGARFYRWIAVPGVDHPVIRLVTAWATTEAEVGAFLALLATARAAA